MAVGQHVRCGLPGAGVHGQVRDDATQVPAETAMARYEHLIGPKLRARSLPTQ